MIHIIATITARAGAREELLRHMLANVPNVLEENGCHGYQPTVDFDSGLAAQAQAGPDTVVLIECWESLDHLRAHLNAPHMQTYRDRVKDLVRSSSLRVLSEAVCSS